MALNEERIKEVLTKDITTKTMLIEPLKLESTEKEYLNDGWKEVSISQLNGFYKVTFQKVEKTK